MKMKTYTFIIGSTDDFESIDALIDWADAEAKHPGSIHRNAQIWEFDCPADCSEEIVMMMGRGYAFSSDWAMDGTLSYLIDGSIDQSSEDEMFNIGVAAKEASVIQRHVDKTIAARSEQQHVDVWNPNDPIEW